MGIPSVSNLADGKNVKFNSSEKIQASTRIPASFPLETHAELPQIAIKSVQLEQIFSIYHTVFGHESVIPNRSNISQEGRYSLIQAIFQKIMISYGEITWSSLNHEILLRLEDAQGMDIFLTAIKEGSQDCIEMLIQELGYENLMSSKDSSKRNGLHIAAIYGHSHLVEFLISKAYFSPQDKDSHGLNPLHWAIHERHLDALQKLLTSSSLGDSWTPSSYPDLHISILALAVASGCQESIALLLNHNTFKQLNLSESISSFGNILHLAIHANQSHLLQHLIGDHQTMKELFEAKDFAERTPLQLAALLGDLTAIYTLVKGGCLINQGASDSSGTPLLFAAKSKKPEAIQLLITLGADPYLIDKNGLTPLQHLKQQKQLSFRGIRCKNLLENIQNTLKIGKTKEAQQGQRLPMNLVLDSLSDEKMVYQGIVQALEKKKVMPELSRISGQGMGALIASLLSCGYSSNDLEEKLPSSLSSLFFSDEEKKIETLSVFMKKLRINEENELKNIILEMENNSLCDHIQFQQEMDRLIYEKMRCERCTFGELAIEVRKWPAEYKHLHLFVFSVHEQKIIRMNSEEPKWKDVVISSAVTASLAFSGIFSPMMLLGKNEEGDLYETSKSKTYHAASPIRPIVQAFDDHSYQEDPYFMGRKTNDRTLCFSVHEDQEDVRFMKEMKSKSLLRYLMHSSLQQDLNMQEISSQGRIILIDLPKDEKDIMTLSQTIVEDSLSLVSVPSTQQSQIGVSSSLATILTPWKYRFFLEAPQLDIPLSKIKKGKYEDIPSLPLSFIERSQELESIVEAFKTHAKVAIAGSGGMGKSTLAMKYGHAYKDNYEFVLFAKVSSEAELIEKLLELAKGFKIIEENPQEALKVLKAKLHRIENPYLFIIDGFDHQDLFPLIKTYLPRTFQCKILMTTRAGLIAEVEGFHKIKLFPFKPEEAVNYLLKRTERCLHEDEKTSIVEITQKLGYLPLALTHAAGYIKEQNITFEEYLKLFKIYYLELFHAKNINILTEEESILTTWHFSINTIAKMPDGDLAKQLIEMISCLGEGLIPYPIFEKWISLFYLEKDELTLRRALRLLMNYSLINSQKENQSKVSCYEIHLLVQQSIKYQLSSDEKKKNISQIRDVLDKELDELRKQDKYERSILIEYGTHASSLLASDGFKENFLLERKRIFIGNLTNLYKKLCLFGTAEKYAQDELKMSKEIYGENSHYTAESYQVIGEILKGLGKIEDALQISEMALRINQKVHGENSHYTAESYQAVGEILRELGRVQDGLKMNETALEINLKVHGEETHYTAESYQAIGRMLRELGQGEKALEMSEKALKIKQKVLGEDTHYTSESYQAVGEILRELGKDEEALKMHKAALQINQKVFGEESRYTADSYQTVGRALRWLGRGEEALKISEKALKINLKVFGEESRYTAESYQAVGRILRDLGREEEALEMCEKALKIKRKVLGEETRYTAESYQAVGEILRELGRIEEALKMSEIALNLKQKVYGEESDYTASSYEAIGKNLRELGRLEEALKMSEAALKIRQKILGEESPYTAATYHVIAEILNDLGRVEESIKTGKTALEINQKVRGDKSRYTGESYETLAKVFKDSGRLEDALGMSYKALEIHQKIYGEESKHTLASHKLVKKILSLLNKVDEADFSNPF
ncbi:tetratricopeptide repeat protein [Rhabdochlamydiaceae symbiont of Dictyostelium giganteum]|uniref:tetratricopeptide repeat protein n=1 Tax=Rhabdochlamydiaceae symbiont of Dictyostelium giganteum TaxID=3342349 RepID=UPI00384D42DE